MLPSPDSTPKNLEIPSLAQLIRGRYYILALKSEAPELFEDIPWHSETMLSSTEAKAKHAGRNVELLPQLAETTNLEDWQRLLTSPLGAALKKALGEPLEDISL